MAYETQPYQRRGSFGREDSSVLKWTQNVELSSVPVDVETAPDRFNIQHRPSVPLEYPSQRPPDFDDTDTILQPELGVLDVVALVFNKMVGTGIFTTAGAVLRATGSKGVSLGLWAAGGVYTACCASVYLELGAQYPYDGGELIYLDRTLRPGLLWALIFSSFFILISNTTANALAFARFVMLAALPQSTEITDLDPNVVRLIAVDILSVVCLLHAFSSRLGLVLNKVLGLYKLILLLAVFIAGLTVGRRDLSPEPDDKPVPTQSTIGAIVLVLYSYTGWENANYVAGEIASARESKRNALPIGAYTAIAVVTVCYLLVTVSYYLAFSYADIVDNLDLGVARNLAPLKFLPYGSGLSLDILIALSAVGNLVAVVYTSARGKSISLHDQSCRPDGTKVKQVIARQRLIPFWRTLEKDKSTPKGGLALHWLFGTILIVCAPVSPDGYSLVAGLYTYGQIITVTIATAGLFFALKRRQWSAETTLMKATPIAIVLIMLVFLANLVIAVIAFIPNNTGSLPEWLWPAVIFPVLLFGVSYWAVLHMLKSEFGKSIGIHIKEYRPDGPTPDTDEMKEAVREALHDGTSRRLQLELSGFPQGMARRWTLIWTWISRHVF